MVWMFSILAEEPHAPFIGCQSQGRVLMLKLLGQRRFSRARQSHHQMESRHTYHSKR